MNKIFLLTSILVGLTCSALFAQQPWRFHIAFEDGTGQRDTLWMVFDNSATVEGVDYQLGEGTPEYDPNAFNVFMYNMDVDSTKVKAYPYCIYPTMSTDEVFAINYTYPVIIRWDSSMFHIPFLPNSPPMNYAIILGDYQFGVLGPDPTSPYPHNVFMFTKDSLYCPEDTLGSNPIPLFGFGCLGFRVGYDAYLSTNNTQIDKIYVFPNPVLSAVYFKGIGEIKSYAIYDMNGLKIYEKILKSTILISDLSIDVSTFHKGIYIIQLVNQLNQFYYEKIIIDN